jgi:hypothetical protein
MFRAALAAVPAGANRASRVRVFCLQEARARARARELALGSPPAVLAQAADPSPR